VVGLYIQLNSFIWEQRIYRRYLRSRFGMKQKLLQRLVFKQTRAAQAERNNFRHWLRKNGRSRGVPEFYDIGATYRLWRKELSGEKALFRFARDMFVRAHTIQTVWENCIYISFSSLYEKHGGPGFPLKEFALDILQRMKPALKEFSLIMRISELELKQEFSLDYEDALVNLTAWAARNINLGLNRGAAQALSVEGKPLLEAKLEKLPANILLTLAERDKRGIKEVSKILPRIAEMLREEQPLDAKHEALRRGRSRKVAKKENTETTLEEKPEGQIIKPEDLAERQAEEFVLREEARIDLEKVIKLAKLTPSEWEVLELDLRDLTDIEIAQHLGKPVGTIKPLLFKARRKLRQVGIQS
jgi:RNA polymerase sigma factor (sigma-70 family)